ncbi:cell division ATP-binding protein FtsE [Brassicibacter mesophilus]|uniref:cell division ATP-binding protein FtsE n=1 Tax=Brassicibacter mesophilus TaxID=745119 RepID=UPI003D1F3F8F
MIEANSISLKYPNGTLALKNTDLQVDPGEIVYITGPSGSGKTSLLKLFMGVEYPTTGSLKVLGYHIAKGNTENIRQLRMKIGPVFQEFRLIKGRTAIENVMLGMRFLGIPYGQLKENANDALIKVGLERKVFSLVENLSWGECQRVAIARAVARKPLLILADEPTGNLDIYNALNILDLLTSFKDDKTAVIITTHATHLIEDKKEGKLIQVEGGNICCGALG